MSDREGQQPPGAKPKALDYAAPVTEGKPQRQPPPMVSFVLAVAAMALVHGAAHQLACFVYDSIPDTVRANTWKQVCRILESPRLPMPNVIGGNRSPVLAYSLYLATPIVTSLLWGFVVTIIIYVLRWLLTRRKILGE